MNSRGIEVDELEIGIPGTEARVSREALVPARRLIISTLRYTGAVALGFCLYLAARQGVAAWYFRQSVPSAVQAAIRWDSGNPEYFDRLADLQHQYADSDSPDEMIRLYETATQLSLEKAQYWADLGTAYDWEGQTEKAERAYERAVQLFPNSPEMNWTVANFDIRTGRITNGLQALRKVLLGNSIPPRTVFTLASDATSDTESILKEMVPQRTDILLDYLDYQIEEGNVKAAKSAWTRLLKLNLQFELPQAFPYLDGLIHQREVDALTQAWAALGIKFPRQVHPQLSEPNRITNGGFETEILNGGLGWRVIPVDGAAVSLDTGVAFQGKRSLRIDFDGMHNLNYGNVMQYVPVEPDTSYKFTGYMRTAGVTTDSGPIFQICDAYDMRKLYLTTENLTGTTDWEPEQLEFRTGPNMRMLIVRVARPASQKFDNQIAGTIWVDDISLVPER